MLQIHGEIIQNVFNLSFRSVAFAALLAELGLAAVALYLNRASTSQQATLGLRRCASEPTRKPTVELGLVLSDGHRTRVHIGIGIFWLSSPRHSVPACTSEATDLCRKRSTEPARSIAA